MSLQILLIEYYMENNHPYLNLFVHYAEFLNGEEIELGNRLLSQTTKSDSRRSNADALNSTYQGIGMMLHSGMELHLELDDIKPFSKGPRRYNFKYDDPVLQKTTAFIRSMSEKMILGTWKHYYMPFRTSKGTLKKLNLTEADVSNHRSYTLQAKDTGNAKVEAKRQELIDVPYLASIDWFTRIQKSIEKLWDHKWNFLESISNDDLKEICSKIPYYIRPEFEKSLEKRIPKKSRSKRKREMLEEE
ncbi:MAG: hypothetical protein M3Y25_04105 [Thermoproteota archaeon]|nr:hypothetical protein [Thermoproteota archaeon]